MKKKILLGSSALACLLSMQAYALNPRACGVLCGGNACANPGTYTKCKTLCIPYSPVFIACQKIAAPVESPPLATPVASPPAVNAPPLHPQAPPVIAADAQQEIARLKNEIAELRRVLAQGGGAAAPIPEQLETAIHAFETSYTARPIDVAPILRDLAAANNPAAALQAYDFMNAQYVHAAQLQDNALLDRIINDLDRFTNAAFVGPLITQRETAVHAEEVRQAVEAGRVDYEQAIADPDLNARIDQSPVLNLLRVDPNKFKLINAATWRYFSSLMKYCPTNDLKAAFYYIGRSPLFIQGGSAESIEQRKNFLESLFALQRARSKGTANVIAYSQAAKIKFDKDFRVHFTNNFIIDYAALAREAKGYQGEYNAIMGNHALGTIAHPGNILKASPLLYLLLWDPHKLENATENNITHLKEYDKNASADEMKAALYALEEAGFLKAPTNPIEIYANYLYRQIKGRGNTAVVPLSGTDQTVFARNYLPGLNAAFQPVGAGGVVPGALPAPSRRAVGNLGGGAPAPPPGPPVPPPPGPAPLPRPAPVPRPAAGAGVVQEVAIAGELLQNYPALKLRGRNNIAKQIVARMATGETKQEASQAVGYLLP